MNDVIIAQIIIGIFTVVGTIITVIANNKTTQWRIQELEKKVEKHNNLVERITVVETEIEQIKEQI